MPEIVLASSSVYRRQLLERLGLPFSIVNPDIDESADADESPQHLCLRLATAKAMAAVALVNSPALIIGSDQIALLGDQLIGKPGGRAQALAQLAMLSGQSVVFYTSVCLMNTANGQLYTELVLTEVVFRTLTAQQISNYLAREPALNCAGSFKSEGLGISLVEKVVGDDPSALIGLPLISLIKLLEYEGVNVI